MKEHPDSDETRLKIMEGIARGLVVAARYNNQALTLAPHALFSRRGDLFVSALNLSKIWRSDDEQHVGYFKLAGLSDVEVTAHPFEALPNAVGLPRSDDELLLAVS